MFRPGGAPKQHGGSSPGSAPQVIPHRLPAEFEPQDAIVLGCAGVIRNMPQLFVNIVRALLGRIRIVCLVNPADEALGEVLLSAARLPRQAVEFTRLPSVSMWARDWCPISAFNREGQRRFLAFELRHLRTSANGDAEPVLSRLFSSPVLKLPLALEGGNILSNGDGLCLTSTTIFPKNAGRNLDQAQLGSILANHLGVSQWAYLDPLSGESTGHIDLFCSFLAKDLVVVGQYDAKADGVNAALLDHSAKLLAGIRTPAGPLRVVRVPMPPPVDGRYRSYTNLIFANSTVLVPLYPQIDDELDRRALALYKEWLPDREVIGLDVSEMATLGGGLHCMSSNICPAVAGIRRPESFPEVLDAPVESVGVMRA